MATTIAHPRSVRSGRSGKTIAGFLVGMLVAVAVGYGITNAVDTEAADFAAQQAAVARGERMLAINELWPVPSTSSAADFGLDGASHALPEYIRDQLDTRAQNAQLESQIEFLTEQWNARQSKPEPKNPGLVE